MKIQQDARFQDEGLPEAVRGLTQEDEWDVLFAVQLVADALAHVFKNFQLAGLAVLTAPGFYAQNFAHEADRVALKAAEIALSATLTRSCQCRARRVV